MENSKSEEKVIDEKCALWKRRTLLERYLLLISLVFIIAFLVIVGLLLHLENVWKKSKKEVCLNNICKHQAGSILTNMDLTVDPCDNFYEFSCGSHLKYKSIYGEEIRSFISLQQYVVFLKKEEVEKPEITDDFPFVNKVKKYYQSCLNKPTELKQVVKELLQALHFDDWPVNQYDNSRSLIEEAAAHSMILKGSELLFNGMKSRGESHIQIREGSTSVNRNILINKTEERFIKLKEQYANLFNYVFLKLNLPVRDLEMHRDEIIEFETSLAEIQDDRDDNSTNSTIIELQSICEEINWKHLFMSFFGLLGHSDKYNEEYSLKIDSMEYINDVCKLVGKTKPRIVYNVLVWNILLPYLSNYDFVFKQLYTDFKLSAHYGLRASPIPGTDTLKWKACIMDIEDYIDFGITYMVLKSMDAEEQIKEVSSYTDNIREKLDEIFSEEDWIDKPAKNFTKLILKNIKVVIGYGNGSVNEELLNMIFEKINITSSYAQNMFAARKEMMTNRMFNTSVDLYRKIQNDPLEVGASFWYQAPFEGYLDIPLGIMHPPFYAHKLPQYLNFGGIAFVIAHEFSHAFDRIEHLAVNRQEEDNSTDENDTENVRIDLSEEFLEDFKNRKICLIDQYSQFPLEENLTINANATIQDNYSDNSGLTVAYLAYEKYLKKHGNEPQLPGLHYTNKQMFFIGYSQLWCETIESMKNTYEKDSHSPGRYRVLVPLMNSPEFSKAFNCPLNSYMNPQQKCSVWR